MSAGRINWARFDSGDLEHMVAMLICADNPLGQKFTPGPDGGIDVFVPDGANRRRVYQVKNFPLKFTNSEFRQVKKSLKSVAATARKEGWTITEWHLVTPRDSSKAYRAKIDTVVRDHGITTWSWMGLTQLDILAARHPELADYYVNSGMSRLTEQLADLTAIIRGDHAVAGSELLQPSDVVERIETLQRAANNDPHFRYHFATSDHPPEPTTEPWLVAVAAEQHGPMWVHIKVYAKFLAALDERPVTTTVHVDATDNPDLAESFEQFLDYGVELHIPSDAASATIDLPGNLGGEHDATEVHITSVTTATATDAAKLVVGVRDPEGVIVSELEVHRIDRTVGVRGGIRTVWTDDSGLFTLDLRTKDDDANPTANIGNSWSVAGRLPADIVGALTWMDSMESGRSLAISPAHGPRRYSGTALLTVEPNRDLRLTTRVAAALDRLQAHCTDLLRMPEELPAEHLRQLFDAATLVQGQTSSASWDPFSYTSNGSDAPTLEVGERVDVAVTTPLTITISGVEHRIGLAASFLDATVTKIEDRTVFLAPTNPDGRATRVLATGDEHQVWVGPAPTNGT